MRGILIKAAEKKVVAVDVKPEPNRSREGLRALDGREWGRRVVVGDCVTVWVDEEGRAETGFRLKDIPTDFVGNGVLLSGDACRARVCKTSPEVVGFNVVPKTVNKAITRVFVA